MKRILIGTLLSAALVLPAHAHAPGDGREGDHHHDGPKTAAAKQAPANPTPAPAASSPAVATTAPAPAKTEVSQITAHVVVENDKDGKPVAKAKIDDGALIQLEGDKIADLLKVEKLGEKQFVFSGEKRPAAAGASESFLVKEFFELEHDHSAHGHEGDAHGIEDHSGHNH